MMRPGSHFQEFGVRDGRKQAGLVGIYTLCMSTVFYLLNFSLHPPPHPPAGNLAFPVFTFEFGFG